jgi:hypothetical protein
MRPLPKGSIGKLGGNNPLVVPTTELGWLSPVRPSASGGGWYRFRCRCGSEVIRMARDVRQAVKRGLVPRCRQTCTGSRLGTIEVVAE